MKETILVYVNDQPAEIFRGMKVKHALIALDQALYAAALSGKITVHDANGFALGLDGTLQDGAKIYTIDKAK